jgi:hypothetical protein
MNGWKNYQTWTTVLWGCAEIDEELEAVIENARGGDEKRGLQLIANYLRERFLDHAYAEVEAAQERRGYPSALDDLLFYAVDGIDWYEIATNLYRVDIVEGGAA